MKNKIFVIFFSILIILTTGNLYSKEKPVFIKGINALATGGARLAMPGDQNAFFYNPSSITSRKTGLITVFDLKAGISQDSLDFIDWFQDNRNDLEKFDKLDNSKKNKLLNDITNKISAYNNRVIASFPNFCVVAPPIGNTYLGFGIFDQMDVKFGINSGLLVPTIDIDGSVDIAGMFLLAHKFTDKFSAGVNAKYLGRISIFEDRMSVLALDGYEPVLQPGFGFGADFGASYKMTDKLSLGMSITDIGGTKVHYHKVDAKIKSDGKVQPGRDERTGIITQRWNIGAAYSLLPCLTFGLDFLDITDEDGDRKILDYSEFLTKTHFGAEFTCKFFALRGGFNSGYPTFGVGIYLWALKLDYAYYTNELGLFPGDHPERNHVVSLGLKF